MGLWAALAPSQMAATAGELLAAVGEPAWNLRHIIHEFTQYMSLQLMVFPEVSARAQGRPRTRNGTCSPLRPLGP